MSSTAKSQSDNFMTAISQFFEGLVKRSKLVAISALILVILAVIGAYVMSRQDSKMDASRNALYAATKAYEVELKAVATANAPAAAQAEVKTDTKVDKDKKAEEARAEAANLDAVRFKKLDVDAKFPEALKKFRAVADEYPGTRTAFEAELGAADLYYRHGESAKAVDWYQKAVSSAPDSLGKALALTSLGYAQENSGKCPDALGTYQKALNVGEVSIKSDVMMSMARCYEAANDATRARATYEQVIKDFPGSDASKSAELFKSQLK